jgi:hypothetical protein
MVGTKPLAYAIWNKRRKTESRTRGRKRKRDRLEDSALPQTFERDRGTY